MQQCWQRGVKSGLQEPTCPLFPEAKLPSLAFLLYCLPCFLHMANEVRLIQNNAATADATPHEQPVKGSHWNLRLPQKGKCRDVLQHHPGPLSCAYRAQQWRSCFLMHVAEDQKVLSGAHISPLFHTLPVGTKHLFLDLTCKSHVKFPQKRGILTRAYTGVAASCYLSCDLFST